MPQTANSPGLTVDFLEKTLRKGKNIIYNIFQKRIKPRNRSNNENNENDSFFYRKTSYAAYFVIPVVGIILHWNFVILGEIKEKQNVVVLKCCYI